MLHLLVWYKKCNRRVFNWSKKLVPGTTVLSHNVVTFPKFAGMSKRLGSRERKGIMVVVWWV